MKKKRSPLESNPLFGPLPLELSENIRSLNPWWQNQPASPLPSFRRWPFKRLKHLLFKGMTPAVVLRGPRRVGKTVLLKQRLGFGLSWRKRCTTRLSASW